MLDFQKLIGQIEAVGRDSLIDTSPQELILSEASLAFDEAAAAAGQFLERLEENQVEVLWPVALPAEPFGTRRAVEPRRDPVTVVATDGSQIMPSHHEVYSCYLLNIGMAVVSYGAKHRPVLESEPRLYHRPEDLYPLVDRRRIHIDELYVALERTILELETLTGLSLVARERKLPVVAMLDGSLIPWSVEKMPQGYQTGFQSRMQEALAALEEARIPLVGYVSHSRSSDLINMLRVWVCPYRTSDCRSHCGHLNEEDFPCSRVWPLTDRQLMISKLRPGERGAVCMSAANVARSMPSGQATCFAYLHVGYEVCRVEFPRWLLTDPEALDLAFETVRAQVEKGRGYPVCLAEAHNLAVIRGQDRSRFFELVARHLVSIGIDRVGVSPKESRKRRGIV